MRWGELAGAAAAALALAHGAQAGLRVDLRSTQPGEAPGAAELYVIWIDGSRLAAEPVRKAGEPASRRVIYRAAEDLAWLVDVERRSYFQLDPASAEKSAAQVAGVRGGLAQGIELLPPEQQAAARELLGDLAEEPPSAPLPELRLRALGEPGSYAGIACARHDVLAGDRRLAVVCLGEYGKGLPPRERVAAIGSLGGFLRRTLTPLARQFPDLRPLAALGALERLPGFPLALRSFEDRGGARLAEATRVEEAAVDPSLFELPAGFTRSSVPPFH